VSDSTTSKEKDDAIFRMRTFILANEMRYNWIGARINEAIELLTGVTSATNLAACKQFVEKYRDSKAFKKEVAPPEGMLQ
jgi:hypothetical protein